MQGTWEARTSHDGVCTCTHDGDTWHPLCLQAEIRGGTYDLDLTALFSEWRVQEDRCALVQAPQILCVTSPRWLSSAAGGVATDLTKQSANRSSCAMLQCGG